MIYNKYKHQRVCFLISILLLLLNDFFLKEAYHNFLTGKLSDFTGLFALPYFLSLIFPKFIKANYVFSAIFFIIWKTELIQPIFDVLNSIGLNFTRVIDYTDLIALSVLPLSYLYWNNESFQICRVPDLKPVIMIACSFAFIATSGATQMQEVNMECNVELRTKMDIYKAKRLMNVGYSLTNEYSYSIKVPEKSIHINTEVVIKIINGELSVRLLKINSWEIKGNLLFGIDHDDEVFLDNLKCSDYQKLFLESVQRELY